MIDQETQLKVQALLDGELAPAERKFTERLVSANPQAKALLEELRSAKTAFASVSSEIRAPLSREHYWSAIESSILRGERSRTAEHPGSALGWLELLRRYLVPAGTLAALVIAGLFAGMQSGLFPDSKASRVESALASSGSLTYRDFDSRTTLVWLTYPAEKEFASYVGNSTLP